MQKIRFTSNIWLRMLYITITIAVCVFIFCMSNEPAAHSAERSGSITEMVVNLIFPDLDSCDKDTQQSIILSTDHIIRKLAHFVIFAFLGGMIFLTSTSFYHTLPTHILLAWGGATLFAISDEVHQMYVLGRGPSLSDIILDSFGAIVGVIFISPICLRIENFRQKKAKK